MGIGRSGLYNRLGIIPKEREEGRLVVVRIGVPKEIKPDEYRVAMMPVGVESLVKSGHQVFVEASAGASSGFTDETYKRAGATIVPTHAEAISDMEMVIKVKEPQTAGDRARSGRGRLSSRIFISRLRRN